MAAQLESHAIAPESLDVQLGQLGDGAYVTFIAFYVVCCLVTWMVFMRQRPGAIAWV
jgi:hypothetical protein